jgi:hypothetical protein
LVNASAQPGGARARELERDHADEAGEWLVVPFEDRNGERSGARRARWGDAARRRETDRGLGPRGRGQVDDLGRLVGRASDAARPARLVGADTGTVK